MIAPKIPENESLRLLALDEYAVLDTMPEDDYDDLTKLASDICDTPISLVSLIDESRQWFKSHHGLDATETPREIAFCAHAINEPQEIFIINDSRIDDRFHDNPLVTDKPDVIFYAGVPLVNTDGYALGTLCAIDHKPRELDENQINALKIIAKQVIKLFELRKNNIILNQSRILLEKKNKDINESIEYAKKIQFSILPDLKKIDQFFSQFITYFNPKEVIGGDFYWFERQNDKSYIAVIDCTGHSVPGALLSIVVSSILNQIMNERVEQSTSEILETLHEKLYTYLKQEKGDLYSQDGCDISLCKIDHNNNFMQFSGAHQHLYIVQNEKTEIIKGDQKNIGGLSLLGVHEPKRKFKAHNFEIQNDSIFLLTTDGILDQLNDKDEVFGTKRLIRLINHNFNSNKIEKEKFINKEIIDWKKNTTQLDDMLLIAFNFESKSKS